MELEKLGKDNDALKQSVEKLSKDLASVKKPKSAKLTKKETDKEV